MAVLPDFDPANFETDAPIDNPYFPVAPGAVQTFAADITDPETGEVSHERNDLFATFETREVDGVQVHVVRDTSYADGVLVEDTLDFYAQDEDGNVWYLGELVQNYRYDDRGSYTGTDNAGSWEAGVSGAKPGHLMKAEPGFGAAYYQEFAPGIAEDEGIVAGLSEEVTIGLGTYTGVLKTIDSSALEPDKAELKYHAPGVGPILTEGGFDENGEPTERVELIGTRVVEQRAPGASDGFASGDLAEKQALTGVDRADQPDDDRFVGDGSDRRVTFVQETADLDNAIGAYTFDVATGEIKEGRILFDGTDGVQAGESVAVTVAPGEALGLFVVPNGADLGIDLARFEEGGLHFESFLTGAPATIDDRLAPLVTDADGTALPIPAFHALGNVDGFNFLNPAAGVQGIQLRSAALDGDASLDAALLGFEDLSVTGPGYDGDFNDIVIAVSNAPVPDPVLRGLLTELA